MKKIFLLSLISLISSVSFAQKISAQWGDEIKFEKGFMVTGSLGIQDGKLYVNSARMAGLFGGMHYGIGMVDVKTLKVIRNTELVVETKKTTQLATILIKGNRWLFTRNTADKIDYIKAYPIDKSGAVVEKPIVMASFKDTKGGFLNTNTGASIELVQSKDSSKIGLVINANRKKKEKELYYVSVFDASMKQEWTETIELPYSEKRFEAQAANITNTGEFQVVGKLYSDEKAKDSKSKTEAGYNYIIRTYSDKEKEGKEYVINLGGKFAEQVFISTRPDNGNTVIAGMYSNKHGDGFFESSGVLNGFYYMELAPDGTVANKYIKELDAAKIKNISNALLMKKENGIVSYSKIIDVFFKKNGSLIIVTEASYMTTHRDPKTGSVTYTYYNLDNIVYCLDPKGNYKWGVSVPKKQVSGSNYTQGAIPIFKNDNLFLVYNDSEKNLEKDPDGSPKGLGMFGKSVVTLALVNSDGKLSRKALTTAKDLDNYIFTPKASERIGEDELIFVAAKGSLFTGFKNKIARIKIGE